MRPEGLRQLLGRVNVSQTVCRSDQRKKNRARDREGHRERAGEHKDLCFSLQWEPEFKGHWTQSGPLPFHLFMGNQGYLLLIPKCIPRGMPTCCTTAHTNTPDLLGRGLKTYSKYGILAYGFGGIL